MKKKIVKYALLSFFFLMTAAMLLSSKMSAQLALEGLNLWFQKMIPALLPFMILSGILIRLNLSDSFASLFAPVLRPVFRLSDSCLYCLVIGFLCGFPMGAKVCAESYQRGRLTRRECTLMLSFCNNIGPIYFTGYVLRLFPVEHPAGVFIGMYGMPLLYGLFLRYTLFRDIPPAGLHSFGKRGHLTLQGQCGQTRAKPLGIGSIFREMNASIMTGLDSITVLGGYMIFCNLLNLLPYLLFSGNLKLLHLTGGLLEITSGLARFSPSEAYWAYVLLPFGGLSCIAQTYSCIHETDLSLKEYVFHKGIQMILAAAFYSVFFLR